MANKFDRSEISDIVEYGNDILKPSTKEIEKVYTECKDYLKVYKSLKPYQKNNNEINNQYTKIKDFVKLYEGK